MQKHPFCRWFGQQMQSVKLRMPTEVMLACKHYPTEVMFAATI